MEKLLLASTALVATAGVAAAEINFGGFGRFGISYYEDRHTLVGAVGDPSDTILNSRFRLTIDGIAETDGGAKFEARLRVQAEENNLNGEANTADANGARFSVSYGGLRVDAGNVGGAFDNLNKYYGYEVGLETFANQYSGVDYSFLSYSSGGAGGNSVFFNYEVGAFGVGASYDQRSDADGGDRWDVGATYTFNNVKAAVAHGQTDAGIGGDDPSLTALTVHGEFGDLAGVLFIADDKTEDPSSDGTAYGLSASYTLGATTLLFAYGDGSAVSDRQWVGIGATYDLGGGASLSGGVGRFSDLYVDTMGEYDKVVADFGAQFNF